MIKLNILTEIFGITINPFYPIFKRNLSYRSILYTQKEADRAGSIEDFTEGDENKLKTPHRCHEPKPFRKANWRNRNSTFSNASEGASSAGQRHRVAPHSRRLEEGPSPSRRSTKAPQIY